MENDLQELEKGLHDRAAVDLLRDKELIGIYKRYKKDYRSRLENHGLNVFTIVSETFYRENFHSDILKAFLDMNGAHGQGNLYFDNFINLIKDLPGGEDVPDAATFGNYTTEREKDHIDLSILGKKRNNGQPRAIIIENKINNAGDRPRQLPTYYNKLQKNGFEVAAVVYLSLGGDKEPTMVEWEREEIEAIKPRLIKLGAFTNGKSPDLLHWVRRCITKAGQKQSTEAKAVLQQYERLLNHLGADIMNNEVMRDFYKLMQKTDRYAAAGAVGEMMERLPAFAAEQLVEKFAHPRCLPFDEAFYYPEERGYWPRAVLGYKKRGFIYGTGIYIEICCHDFFYVGIGDRCDRNGSKVVRKLLKEVGLLGEFCKEPYNGKDWHYVKKEPFKFPAGEKALVSWMEALLKKIDALATGTDYRNTDSECRR